MNLVLVGLNHRTASVEVRERYSVAPADGSGLNEKLVQMSDLDEAVVLSTCNRTELVAVSSNPEAAIQCLTYFLRNEIGDGRLDMDQIYELRAEAVVSHLFSVAASLDSMVLGEAQILGQVKDAYHAGVRTRSCGPILHRLFQRAFRTAKRIRTETQLGSSSVSVARVGIQLARELFESFEDKVVLLIGAGQMAEASLHGLREAGVRELVIANRTLENAQLLARRLNARAVALDDLEVELASADVVLASVQADRPIVTKTMLEKSTARRSGRPLLIVDLAVPRNVASDASELSLVYLYDLDDLEDVARRGRENRATSIAPAEAIVIEERDRYERWREALPTVPTIQKLRAFAYERVRGELAATGQASGAELDRIARSMTAKLLHEPLERLRREAEAGAGLYYRDAVERLFGLEEED